MSSVSPTGVRKSGINTILTYSPVAAVALMSNTTSTHSLIAAASVIGKTSPEFPAPPSTLKQVGLTLGFQTLTCT